MFSKSEPSKNTGYGDHGAVVAHGLVVTGREAPVLFELREQVFDGVAGFVEMLVEGCRVLPARVGRHDSLGPDCGYQVTAGSPVVGAITENGPGLPAHQEASEVLALVRLAWRQHEVHGIPVGIPDQVDFSRETAA